jgi:hypothetical protein
MLVVVITERLPPFPAPLNIAHDNQNAGTTRLQHIDNNQPTASAKDPQHRRLT